MLIREMHSHFSKTLPNFCKGSIAKVEVAPTSPKVIRLFSTEVDPNLKTFFSWQDVKYKLILTSPLLKYCTAITITNTIIIKLKFKAELKS